MIARPRNLPGGPTREPGSIWACTGGDSRISRTRCSSPPAWGWHSHARTSSAPGAPNAPGVGRRDARRGARAADRPGGVGFRPGRPCRLSEPDRGPAGSAGDRGGDRRRPTAEGAESDPPVSGGTARKRRVRRPASGRRVRIGWGAGGGRGGARAGPLAGADHRCGAAAAQSHGDPVPEPDGDPTPEPGGYASSDAVGRYPATLRLRLRLLRRRAWCPGRRARAGPQLSTSLARPMSRPP